MRYLWVILLCLAFASCAKTAPQRPSQRNGQSAQTDTTVIAMMEVNERLVAEADKEVAQWVAAQTETYHLQECGAWRLARTPETSQRAQSAPTPQPKEKWDIAFQVLHLDGRLAEDHAGTFTIARGELPTAVDETVQQMIAGEQTTLITPWYSAYGMRGTEHIQAYENVMIQITLKEQL